MHEEFYLLVNSAQSVEKTYSRYLYEKEAFLQKYMPEVFLQIEHLIEVKAMGVLQEVSQIFSSDLKSEMGLEFKDTSQATFKCFVKCLRRFEHSGESITGAELLTLQILAIELNELSELCIQMVTNNRRTSRNRSSEELLNIARESLPEIDDWRLPNFTVYVKDIILDMPMAPVSAKRDVRIFGYHFEKEIIAGLPIRWTLKSIKAINE